jgi:hypothetical protein
MENYALSKFMDRNKQGRIGDFYNESMKCLFTTE